MYTVLDYGRMAMDPVRMDAYARAIARVVKPGDVVVDIGAGTGILSMLAVRAGAKHVHAIETNPAVGILGEIARENGLGDRVTVHARSSFEVELSERADVMVSDLRGSFPLFEDHLPIVRDARTRLLKPGGRMIGERERFYVALVEADDIRRRLEGGWLAFEKRGMQATAVKNCVVNGVFSDGGSPIPAGALLSRPQMWTEIDWRTVESNVFESVVDSEITRGGEAHGLAVWFEAILHEGIGYANPPGTTMVYSRTFLPLVESVAVEAGERATIGVKVDARGTRWAWDTEIPDKCRFRQSSFFGQAVDAASLLRASTTYKPTRAPSGDRLLRVLQEMNGDRSVGDIAAGVGSSFPEGSPIRDSILEEVRDAVSRYGA